MPPMEIIGGVQGYLWWVAGLVLTAMVLGPRFLGRSGSAASPAPEMAQADGPQGNAVEGEAR